jgi:hypothetical protein
MVADVHLLVIEKHAVYSLNRVFCRLGRLIMNEAVAPGTPVFIRGNFAGQYIAKSSKSVMESLIEDMSSGEVWYCALANLVINLLVQIFYEYIALPSLTKGRVALRPHDPAGK